ncbi:hypothetical protein GCM10009612_44120 [Streptomyces beijiangensis]
MGPRRRNDVMGYAFVVPERRRNRDRDPISREEGHPAGSVHWLCTAIAVARVTRLPAATDAHRPMEAVGPCGYARNPKLDPDSFRSLSQGPRKAAA